MQHSTKEADYEEENIDYDGFTQARISRRRSLFRSATLLRLRSVPRALQRSAGHVLPSKPPRVPSVAQNAG